MDDSAQQKKDDEDVGPKYMTDLFKTQEELGRRSVRRSKDIYLPIPKSNWLAKSFSYRLGQEWNLLPIELRESTARDQVFRKRLKMFFKNRLIIMYNN